MLPGNALLFHVDLRLYTDSSFLSFPMTSARIVPEHLLRMSANFCSAFTMNLVCTMAFFTSRGICIALCNNPMHALFNIFARSPHDKKHNPLSFGLSHKHEPTMHSHPNDTGYMRFWHGGNDVNSFTWTKSDRPSFDA